MVTIASPIDESDAKKLDGMANPLRRDVTTLERLRGHANSGRLYGILDACEASAVPAKAQELSESQACSLFQGTAREAYWDIAPYLVRVDEPLLGWIQDVLWSQPWGVLIVSASSLEDLRKHLRHFLVVQSPQLELWYFRFYDPRVLGKFVEACTATELDEFFGPIEDYLFADHDTDQIVHLTRKREQDQAAALPRIVFRSRSV